MFLSSSTFTSASASFDSRITSATNEQDLSYFATTGSNTFIGNQTISGSLLFSGSNDEQTLSYAGGNGHQIIIDTNRTDDYTENGSADKPYKTLSSAITAANTANPNGTDPYTFVMMGSNIDENISFNGTAFNFITLATSCRTVFNGTLTITNNPNLKQLVIRNLEFAQAVTITGNGTAAQMNNMSFYNTSFSNTLNVTCANSLALWDVYSSAAVNLTNLHYLYVGGGQITGDVTIVADSTQTLPSEGMSPGQSIVFDLICNNLTFTRGGSATYVFQPHNTRIGLNAGSYTIPNGFTLSAQASTLRGTWTNNGSLTLRNSSTDNAVVGTQPTYTGTMGGTFKGVINSTNGVISGSSQISGFGFATTGSNTFVGGQTITGSLNATSITGSILATNGLISGSSQLTSVFPEKITGSWSVPTGTSIQSFTVDSNHSYQMWVNGNIPNGILTWNATVNVTNSNVPIVGSQYGWYYPEGNALVLTSIPPQIVGVNGTISTTSFVTTTSNTFEFGITNNSGATQTINYGYIKIS
jgi:hypothetical protein